MEWILNLSEDETDKHLVRKTFKDRKDRGEFVGKFRNTPPDNEYNIL